MSPTKLSKKRQWEEARTKFKHDRQLVLVGNADDDDFVECTKNGKAESQVLLKYKKQKDTDIMNKKQAGSGSDGQCKTIVHNDYPIISCRTSPYCLLKTIAKMTERQKAAVREMGFSHVLDIKILEIPTKLGHWVVKSFEPRSCELILSNKKRIPIVEEDVYRVFGFPRGKRLIRRTTKQDASNMLQEWSKFFDKKKLTTLSPKDVAEVMLKSEDAGTWFKRHFLVLLTACLIENSKTGYIFPHTIDCLGDIERVKEWNWCEYVLRCLITSKLTWEEDTNKAFIGPTLFLLVFYVDRVKILNKTVPRDFPLVVNWDYKELKLRQASEIKLGGFGYGCPNEPINVTMCVADQKLQVENEEEFGNCVDRGQSNNNVGAADGEINGMRYAENIISALNKVAENTLEILKIIQDAPREMHDDMTFKRSVETAHKMIVCGDSISKISQYDIASHTATQLDDAFWAQPHVIETIEAVERAEKKRLDYVTKMDDGPSFSLGFTQFFQAENNAVMHMTPCNDASGSIMHEQNSVENEGVANPNENVWPPLLDAHRNLMVTNPESPVFIGKNYSPCLTRCDNKDTGSKVAPELEKRKCRDRSKLKKTAFFFSPFVKRTVNTTMKLNKTEKALGLYALHNLVADDNEDLFKFGDVVLKRNELMSFEVDGKISIVVIDVWSIIQNYNEIARSDKSPSRFFATTNPPLQAIVSPPDDWTKKRCFTSFHDKLEEELIKFSHVALEKIDLFFFPIYRALHFFLICIDVIKGKIFVIDNTNTYPSEDNTSKYGSLPVMLKDMLSDFMMQKGLRNRVSKLKKATVVIEELAWVDTQPNNDCGVYVMRHMETFMSPPSGKWSSGLSRKSKKQMRVMRVRYCASILGWEKNELHDRNLSMADELYQKICSTTELNIDELLLE